MQSLSLAKHTYVPIGIMLKKLAGEGGGGWGLTTELELEYRQIVIFDFAEENKTTRDK